MGWIEKFNEAVNYMEMHMTDEIDYAKLGQIAGCSACHFQRMFTYMAGLPLSEYIRRRKMSLAAVDLQETDAKVIDVALKYGYNSPTAFNRAFQAVHGMAPSAVRDGGVEVKTFPPVTFELSIGGGMEMNYRIERREAFRITGISAPMYQDIEKNFAVVPHMWQTAAMDGTIPKLAGMMDAQPMGLLGVSVCKEDEQWEYYIAVASSKEEESFKEYRIPASTWAIFHGKGTNTSVQELERQIVMEWLPTSGYEYANAPDIEVYISPDPQNAEYEVWIPVVKKLDSCES